MDRWSYVLWSNFPSSVGTCESDEARVIRDFFFFYIFLLALPFDFCLVLLPKGVWPECPVLGSNHHHHWALSTSTTSFFFLITPHHLVVGACFHLPDHIWKLSFPRCFDKPTSYNQVRWVEGSVECLPFFFPPTNKSFIWGWIITALVI